MKNIKKNKICSRCVLEDNFWTHLTFDKKGVCNNCTSFQELAHKTIFRSASVKKKILLKKIQKIKKSRTGSYDCILGLSGGLDSSYLAYMAHKWGLHPLVVHFDNGWNSEIAVKNIHSIVKKYGFELFTYVIDWEEYKDIQRAYFKASVIDIEVPCDHFIYATLYELAAKHHIRYILDGNNIASEFWGGTWKCSFPKLDLINLLNIHKRFGTVKLHTYPKLGFFQRVYYQNILGIQNVYLLNYIEYNQKKVKNLLKNEIGWKDYGGKHYESIFTRFYQGYILPIKFSVDKRMIHLSNLIWSGQITRKEALKVLRKPPYPLKDQKTDKSYVLKKIGFTEKEFEKIMKMPMVPHETYGTEDQKYSLIISVLKKIMHFVRIFKNSLSPSQ